MSPVVATCGSIHGGEVENAISDRVDLKLNVRTYDTTVRTQVLSAIKEIIKDECKASGAVQEPVIKPTTRFPETSNDPVLAETLKNVFSDFFGVERTEAMERVAGSEDVPNLALPNVTPYVFWFLGGTDPAKWNEAKRRDELSILPGPHSSRFAPDIERSLPTAIEALSLAALRFLTAND